jgi:glutamine transport system permease protein
MFDNFLQIAIQYLPRLLRGALETIRITLIGVSLGFALGLLTGIVRAYKIPIANRIARYYVLIIRGTPLLVQIFFIFFGIPNLIQRPIPPLTAGILAIAINSGAYFGEIIRGALQAIPRGQIEASRSLGLNMVQTIQHVIGPQAMLVALPSLGNQFIISLKDTSLLAVISVEELTRDGQIIIAATFRAFQIWILVALLYLVLTGISATVLMRVEERLGRFRGEAALD